MKFRSAIVCLIGFVVASMSTAQADMVYQIGPSLSTRAPAAYSISGTITTDGKSGTLGTSDILNYSLTFSGPGMSATLNPNNSQASISGSDLAAGSGVLAWDFSGRDSGTFTIADNLAAHQFALQLASGTTNIAVTPGFLSITEAGLSEGATFFGTGAFIIGSTPPALTITPLPPALPMFLSGLGFLGFLGWRRKRKAGVSPIAA